MKIVCVGGPHDGKTFTIRYALPELQFPYPWSKIEDPESIETYRQSFYGGELYEWVGSRPYPNLKDKIIK